ncbi:hypothetical protein [Microcoleus sp. herbarium8]
MNCSQDSSQPIASPTRSPPKRSQQQRQPTAATAKRGKASKDAS